MVKEVLEIWVKVKYISLVINLERGYNVERLFN